MNCKPSVKSCINQCQKNKEIDKKNCMIIDMSKAAPKFLLDLCLYYIFNSYYIKTLLTIFLFASTASSPEDDSSEELEPGKP